MVNKTVKYILMLPMLFVALAATAQGVAVRVGLDKDEILIGEQAIYTLNVEHDADQTVVIPQFDKEKEIAPGVEVLQRKDRVTNKNGERISVKDEYVITAFDSASYVIPQMRILVDSAIYVSSDSLLLRVNTVPMDTMKYRTIAPMRGDIHKTPIEWIDYKYSVYSGIGALIILLIIIWIAIRLYNNKPIIRRVKIKPKEPAHIVAYRKLDNISNNKELLLVERSKEFYTQLTDVLREFITERLNFNAMEMTSSEIIESLLKTKDADSIKELKEMLQLADLVKFSKYEPYQGESSNSMKIVKDFIEKNRASDEEIAALKEREEIEYDKRSLKEKRLLIVLVSIFGIAAIALIVYTIMELYYLFE